MHIRGTESSSFLPPFIKANAGLSFFNGSELSFVIAQHSSGASDAGDAGDTGDAASGVRLGESCRGGAAPQRYSPGKLLLLGLLAVRLVLDDGVVALRLLVWLGMQAKPRGEQDPGASLTAQLLERPEIVVLTGQGEREGEYCGVSDDEGGLAAELVVTIHSRAAV